MSEAGPDVGPGPAGAPGAAGRRRWWRGRVHPLLFTVVLTLGVGLGAGWSPGEVLEQIGRLFVDNRFMTLPIVLVVLVVGLLERHGLKEQAAALIRRRRATAASGVLAGYHVLRGATSAVGLQVGGHAAMVRPLVAPMAEGAAEARHGPLTPEARAEVRAHAAAAENLGNFFSDDIVVAIGPVLLMQGVLRGAGVEVSAWSLGLWGLPTALWVLLVGTWRYRRLEHRLAGPRSDAAGDPPPPAP